jgi:hypothetical protein
MMRGGNLLPLSKIPGHAKVSMTEKYAHLAPTICAPRSAGPSGPWNQSVEPEGQQTTRGWGKW